MQRNPLQVARILWGALIASVLMYGVIGYLLSQDRHGPPASGPPLSLLVPILGAVALMETGLIVMLPRLVPLPNPQTRNILRWALCESIAVFGLVLFMLGASATIFGGFLAWSLLLLVAFAPTQESVS